MRTQIRVGEFWKSKFSLHLRVKVSYDQNVCLGAVFRVLWHVWRPGQLPVGSLDRRNSLCCGDPHHGVPRPRGETKPGSDFKYDTFMGFGVPSTIVKAVCDVRTKKNVVAAAFS